MAKPPLFDRYTHERQKDLLAKADRHERDADSWAMLGHFGLAILAVAFVIACLFIVLFG